MLADVEYGRRLLHTASPTGCLARSSHHPPISLALCQSDVSFSNQCVQVKRNLGIRSWLMFPSLKNTKREHPIIPPLASIPFNSDNVVFALWNVSFHEETLISSRSENPLINYRLSLQSSVPIPFALKNSRCLPHSHTDPQINHRSYIQPLRDCSL